MTSPETVLRERFLALAGDPVQRHEAIALASNMIAVWTSCAEHARHDHGRLRAETALAFWEGAHTTLLAVQASEARRAA